MKRWQRVNACLLTLVLCLSLCPAAAAATAVTPTPPAWCPAEEYAVFADGAAYQPDTWAKILELRAYAAAGNLSPKSAQETPLYTWLNAREIKYSQDPSIRFELGLASIQFAYNAKDQGQASSISSDFEAAALYCTSEQAAARYLCYLWNTRADLWNCDLSTGLEEKALPRYVAGVEYLLAYPQFTMDELFDCDLVRKIPQARLEIARSLLFVTLDGDIVHPRSVRYTRDYLDTTMAQVRNNRTMVPVRRLAELMGAVVNYDAQTKQITIHRAGDTIIMTIDDKTAWQNGVSLQMDVAPYAENNRTYIPIRYIAEFFGQTVEWRAEKQQVAIFENRQAVSPSNLEAWALPMGAMLSYLNNAGTIAQFGGKTRFGTSPVGSSVSNRLETTGPDFGRQTLSSSWSIDNRADLIETVSSMTDHGHNDNFLTDVAYIKSLTAAQYNQYLNSTGVDSYMFPYTKQLGEKWGDRGILCWDLFRMSNLVQWGYLAGFVTYPEALALLEPAAVKLRENFSSWDEAYENYLDGYNWWARNNVLNQDVWTTERGEAYLEMKADPAVSAIFNDTLFNTRVIPVPDLSARQLLEEIQGG